MSDHTPRHKRWPIPPGFRPDKLPDLEALAGETLLAWVQRQLQRHEQAAANLEEDRRNLEQDRRNLEEERRTFGAWAARVQPRLEAVEQAIQRVKAAERAQGVLPVAGPPLSPLIPGSQADFDAQLAAIEAWLAARFRALGISR